MAAQTIIPLFANNSNMAGPSPCSRLLYTIIPSPYTPRTLRDLLRAWVDDLNKLATNWWDLKGSFKRLRPEDVNPEPYKRDHRSPLRDLLFLRGDAKYIRIDPAHTFAIDGVGKSYYASAVVLLMMMGWFGGSNHDERFKNAYSRFMAFCAAHGKSTSIHDFSFKTFKLPVGSLRAYPRGLGKGHDAAILGSWLDQELQQIDVALVAPEFRDMIAVLKWSCAAINRFWRAIYGNGIWLHRTVAAQIVQDGWAWIDGYCTLAALTSKAGILGFQLRPKLHMMGHLLLDLQYDMAKGAEYLINASVHSTWTDEDFIGRISRISRRTHVLSAARNTLLRALGFYRRQFGNFFDPAYLHNSDS
ncbi:unnamed protein product [Durusdinium trenchii]|uniref:Uncharacterized protein n=2 Tax=Durusdinium trenchii TaxID=1381693 RepID=A0ABP0KYD0_9DINO